LASLAGPSTTVLVITHDADVAAAMRRRLRLRDGRIVGDTGAV
jgi:putative ABC transport system ATP-binding protein